VFRFLMCAVFATLKPKALLVAENLRLRQQLLVLQRRHPRCDFSKLEPPISIAERLGFSINDWPPARTRTANFVRLAAVALAGVVTAKHAQRSVRRRSAVVSFES